jgi:hypothetical protein
LSGRYINRPDTKKARFFELAEKRARAKGIADRTQLKSELASASNAQMTKSPGAKPGTVQVRKEVVLKVRPAPGEIAPESEADAG